MTDYEETTTELERNMERGFYLDVYTILNRT